MAVAALAACRYLSTIVSKVKFRNRPLIPRSPRSTSCSQPGQGNVVVLGVTELRFQPVELASTHLVISQEKEYNEEKKEWYFVKIYIYKYISKI